MAFAPANARSYPAFNPDVVGADELRICFAPVQLENFLYGIQLEFSLPGLALLAAAAVNLSRLSLRARTLINLSLAFVATYTFANGMLVWLLAWPLILPNEHKFGAGRWIWPGVYFVAAALSIGCYFIGYHRPSLSSAIRCRRDAILGPGALFCPLDRELFRLRFRRSLGDSVSGALTLFVAGAAFALWTRSPGGAIGVAIIRGCCSARIPVPQPL